MKNRLKARAAISAAFCSLLGVAGMRSDSSIASPHSFCRSQRASGLPGRTRGLLGLARRMGRSARLGFVGYVPGIS